MTTTDAMLLAAPCMNIPSSPISVDCDSLLVVVPAPRRVRFETATTYVFPVACGGSALPKETGPPVGMAWTHNDTYTTDLAASGLKCRRGRVRKFTHLERIALLRAADVSGHEIAALCAESIAIRTSRAATVHEVRRHKRKLQARRERHHDAADDDDAETSSDDDDAETSSDDDEETTTYSSKRRMFIPLTDC
ncbi:Aste57867_16853 [Aphanomyces stellatus]|uniref:Aste57867_16853 protein n=1 Tax=Aphanomyces stellatus TaxID=120398 RepID=A0A485L9J4_9STRA|nr:hypothetical protein As57867_016795 [Aphanomyces stellatus]VFT93617.1 Aste57867_16853 [Aphanomyces stellatus]